MLRVDSRLFEHGTQVRDLELERFTGKVFQGLSSLHIKVAAGEPAHAAGAT